MRKSIRTGFLGSITIGIHIWILFQLFFQHDILASILWLLVFFVVFHFLYLDIYQKDNKKTLLVFLIISLLEVIACRLVGWDIMIWWLYVMNITILYLGLALESTANESIIFKSREYFRSGGYIFTMWMTIAYSLFSIWLYNNFPFSCTDLSNKSNQVIEIFTKPMNISRLGKQDTSKILSETKVKDLLTVGKILNIESDIKGIPALETFKNRKNDLITKTINDNKELNQGICEYSLNKLNDKIKNPGFQISVVLLMVAISYPFLRIVIQLMSLIWFVLFTIMKKAKVYTIQKITTEIEKIW